MRLIGYVRVSRVGGREGESFISPSVQRESIARFAKANGHEIAAYLEDLDISGGKLERPGLTEALARVESHEVDGIIVAKLDRFARTLVGALAAIERINAANGQLVSVAERFDTSTPMGRAMLQIVLVFAELERERIREEWNTTKRRAITRGVYIGPNVPLGYRRRKNGILEPDPTTAPIARELFARRATGASLGELAAWLDQAAPRPSTWTKGTVSKMLKSRIYLGEIRQGGIVNTDAHEALIRRSTWESAQPRRKSEPWQRSSGNLLSGLLICKSCGNPLSRTSTRYYGCRARRSGGVCPRPVQISITLADDHVAQAFLEWARAERVIFGGPSINAALESAVARVEAAEAELTDWRSSGLLTVMGEDAFTAGWQERAQAVSHARQALAVIMPSDLEPLHSADIPSVWEESDIAQRRALLHAAFDGVIVSPVSPGSRRPVSERLRLIWRDDAPINSGMMCP